MGSVIGLASGDWRAYWYRQYRTIMARHIPQSWGIVRRVGASSVIGTWDACAVVGGDAAFDLWMGEGP
jgi:hypothetical protein